LNCNKHEHKLPIPQHPCPFPAVLLPSPPFARNGNRRGMARKPFGSDKPSAALSYKRGEELAAKARNGNGVCLALCNCCINSLSLIQARHRDIYAFAECRDLLRRVMELGERAMGFEHRINLAPFGIPHFINGKWLLFFCLHCLKSIYRIFRRIRTNEHRS
jgi:hypothetical protein